MPLTITASIIDQDGATQAPLVLGLEGDEALDIGFRYRLTCAFPTARKPTLHGMLGAKAALCITHGPTGNTAKRWLGAHITAWEDVGDLNLKGSAYRVYGATLEPALARFVHDPGSEVWASTSALAVVKSLLEGGDGAGSTADPALAIARYTSFVSERPSRQQVVRWRESTAALVRRLLAEEGIHTWYAHPDPGTTPTGRHVLVLSQRNHNASVPTGGEAGGTEALTPVVTGVVASRDGAELRRLWSWRESTSEGPSTVVLDDPDFRVWPAPTKQGDSGTAPLAVAQIGAPVAVPRGEWRENQGLADLADGSAFSPDATTTTIPGWLASRRAEERLCRRRTLRGEGDHLGLQAGGIFSFASSSDTYLASRVRLTVRPAPQCRAGTALAAADSGVKSALTALADAQVQQRLEADLLGTIGAPSPIAGIEVSWDATSLVGRVEVEAIPTGIPWRPVLRSLPPLAGVYPASVVGASSAAKPGSLYTSADDLGRVQVRLDGVSRATAWIRVVQGAGGLLAVPKVGDRVAVAFAQGDAGRPLVVGTFLDRSAAVPALANAARDRGRTVLRSRFAGDAGYGVESPRQGRLDDLHAWDNDGKGLLATGKRGAGDDANGFGYSEIALDDRDAAGMTRGIDIFSAGGMREQVAGERIIRVGKKLIIEAGEMIELRVGDSRLVLLPGAAQIGYINPTFPAMGSHITCTHSRIEATSLALSMTGWCEASVSTAAAAFEATMTNAKLTGMCAELNSDLIGRLCKLASFFFQTFGSAADPTCRVESEKASDIGMFIAKEVLLNVLALKDVAKYAGRCKGDVIGSSTVATTLGMATVSADPFSAVVSAISGLGLLADIAGSFGADKKGAVGGGLAGAASAGAIIAAIAKRKEIGAAITDLKAGGAGGALGKAGKAVKDLVTPPELNALRIGAISGIRLHGVRFEQLVVNKDETALVNTERAGDTEMVELHKTDTTGSEQEQALQETDSKLSGVDNSVVGNEQGLGGTSNTLAGQESELAASDTTVVESKKGVLGTDMTVVTMKT